MVRLRHLHRDHRQHSHHGLAEHEGPRGAERGRDGRDGVREHDTVRGGGAGEDRGPRVLVRAGHVHGQRVEPV